MAVAKFRCPECGEKVSLYKGKGKFECTECGHVEQREKTTKRCFSCGNEYEAYTWFDP